MEPPAFSCRWLTTRQLRVTSPVRSSSPVGNRGLDGAGLDADFGLSASGFVEAANRETFVVIQIETSQALQNADAIAAVEGVDALFVGPSDLSLRLALDGSETTLEEATHRVAEAAARHGKAWGMAGGNGEDWKRWRAMGAQLLIGGGDFALTNVLKRGARGDGSSIGFIVAALARNRALFDRSHDCIGNAPQQRIVHLVGQHDANQLSLRVSPCHRARCTRVAKRRGRSQLSAAIPHN